MSLIDWMTRNWADTDEDRASSPRPLELGFGIDEAFAAVESAIEDLPRWHVDSIDRDQGVIRATRTTRLCRFVDDVTLRLESSSAGRTRIHARSQSRVGKGDLGQNRRNLLELFKAIGAKHPS